MFLSVASYYERTLIIVDALDECSDIDKHQEDLDAERFLLALKRMGSSVNLLVTCRPHDYLKRELQGVPRVVIRARYPDLKAYIGWRMQKSTNFGARVCKDPNLEETIADRILTSCDGMSVPRKPLSCFYSNLTGFCLLACNWIILQTTRLRSRSAER